ncbi:MAG: DUF1232 domain-containing protein [Chloroflexi bacterium]|nr:DUF1232 domain-containing protein [Chloroflexota bacterium]
MFDKRVSPFTKIIPLIAIVYIVSPYDFIADRIPLLGQFDDLIVTFLLFLAFIAAAPKNVVADQTIGRKLRDFQAQQGFGQEPNNNSNEGKTVDAEFKYVDEDDEGAKTEK